MTRKIEAVSLECHALSYCLNQTSAPYQTPMKVASWRHINENFVPVIHCFFLAPSEAF